MSDFKSKPRFQIPSLRELKQARLLKLLNASKQSRADFDLALAAEHRRRMRKQNPSNNWQQADFGKDLKEHRAEAYAFYCSILRDPNATVQEQLTARERIDKLLGLDLG